RTAARLFSEQGFRHATLEDVAATMGITRAALYHYAQSKDDLVGQCAERAHEALEAALREALMARTGREQLVIFFGRYADIICDDFGRCFVLINSRELSDAQHQLLRARQRRLDKMVRAMAALGVQDGTLSAQDPGDVSHALFGAFNAIPR